MIVVKVGGSLYDLPDLGERLSRLFATLDDDVVLVPGGGRAADLVRKWDRIHRLDAKASHWLAIHAMDLAGGLLRQLTNKKVLNVEHFLLEHDVLPCSWEVTSDSIAALVAESFNASLFILLKSTVRAHNIVDGYFRFAIKNLKCPIRTINLRQSPYGPWPELNCVPFILPQDC